MDGDKQYNIEVLNEQIKIIVSRKDGDNRLRVKGPQGKFEVITLEPEVDQNQLLVSCKKTGQVQITSATFDTNYVSIQQLIQT